MKRSKNQPNGSEWLADLGNPSNWQWLSDVIGENTDQIIKMYPGDVYYFLREEGKKEWLLERLNGFIRDNIKIYINTEIVTTPGLRLKFKPFLKKNPEDFRLLLLMLGCGTEDEIVKKINFLKARLTKKRGRQKAIQKGQLTVILVELFYFFGFNRKHSFEKVALIYTLLNNPKLILKIPENLRNLVTDFLNALPSSPSTIRGLYKRYKKLVELVNFPHSEKTRIRFTEIIPD